MEKQNENLKNEAQRKTNNVDANLKNDEQNLKHSVKKRDFKNQSFYRNLEPTEWSNNLNKDNQNLKDPKQKPDLEIPTFYKNLEHYWREWTGNTSLHGIRYLGEQRRHIFERLWWSMVLVFALSSSTFWISRTYDRWTNNPVTATTPIWAIPFPAVTICPASRTRRSVYNYTHQFLTYKNLSDEELNKFGKVALVCDNVFSKGEEYTDENSIDFITMVAPAPNETLLECTWNNAFKNCEEIFTPILTEEGVCYTFNMLDRDEIFKKEVHHYRNYLKHKESRNGWTLENGYSEFAEQNTLPRRIIAAGYKLGLTFMLKTFDYDHDCFCRKEFPGFKILLHRPDETPRVCAQYFKAGYDQDIIVSVKPSMITASYGLRDFSAEERQCYFSTERSLLFYKNYTQHNCEIECLTNYTLASCGCVAFHMPRNETTRICGVAKMNCTKNAESQLLYERAVRNFKRKTSKHIESGDDCNCFPDCINLSYTMETSQAHLNWKAVVTPEKGNTLTSVAIFFKEMEFIASQRNELYSFEDFLANCGGLLGLFMGFSFVTLAETIYFFTLRLWCNVRRYGRRFWSGSAELINNDSNN